VVRVTLSFTFCADSNTITQDHEADVCRFENKCGISLQKMSLTTEMGTLTLSAVGAEKSAVFSLSSLSKQSVECTMSLLSALSVEYDEDDATRRKNEREEEALQAKRCLETDPDSSHVLQESTNCVFKNSCGRPLELETPSGSTASIKAGGRSLFRSDAFKPDCDISSVSVLFAPAEQCLTTTTHSSQPPVCNFKNACDKSLKMVLSTPTGNTVFRVDAANLNSPGSALYSIEPSPGSETCVISWLSVDFVD